MGPTTADVQDPATHGLSGPSGRLPHAKSEDESAPSSSASPMVESHLQFPEAKRLGNSTNQNEVFKATMPDGRVWVLKYQGRNAATEEYLLGRLGAAIGLSYPVEQVALHPAGSEEERYYTEALNEHRLGAQGGWLIVMPFMSVRENAMAMDAMAFHELGKTFAFDIFIFGKDRFPLTPENGFNNLFFNRDTGESVMLDTGSAFGPYTKPDAHKTKMTTQLTHEVRKLVFNKALALLPDGAVVTKKIRQEFKAAFHQGILDGLAALFAHVDDLRDQFRGVKEITGGAEGVGLIEIEVDKLIADLRQVLTAKRSMHADGKVYTFAMLGA